MPARTDRTTDPDLLAGLLLARRGQAYFSRKLNELPERPARRALPRRGLDAAARRGARRATTRGR